MADMTLLGGLSPQQVREEFRKLSSNMLGAMLYVEYEGKGTQDEQIVEILEGILRERILN